MKKILSLVVGIFITASAAQAQVIEGELLGSVNKEGVLGNSKEVYNDVYFTPQYMPGFPTAATIWPRIILVDCDMFQNYMKCEGYKWLPTYGRGEYLFYTPKKKKPDPDPVVVIEQKVKEVIIYEEVPHKPKKQ